MKICIASQTFAPQYEGGAEISARMGAMALGTSHEVCLLALGSQKDPSATPGESRTNDGLRLVRIAWSNFYLPTARKPSVSALGRGAWHMRAATGCVDKEQLANFLKREEFDILYVQNAIYFLPDLLAIAQDLDLPVCLHLRDYAMLCPRTSMFRDGANCTRPCQSCSLLTYRARRSVGDGRNLTAIAISDFVRQRYLKHGLLQNAKWHVLHNTNTSQKKFFKSLEKRCGSESQRFTFGYLGGLVKEKGVEDLINAFRAIYKKKEARLVIAGRGAQKYETYLRSLVGDAPIEFLGYVNPDIVYGSADVIVVPSRWHEPQSRVAIESAVYGIPVIAAKTGGLPEVVSENHTGWCYDPNQPGKLEELMARALTFGQTEWWSQRDINFSGIKGYRGTAEETEYYANLEKILVSSHETFRHRSST